MKEEKVFRQEAVMSSTHVDLHGDKMTKETLEMAAKTINGNRKPRLGLEHDMTFPPMGRINNAKVIQGEDKEFYLVALQEHFDKRGQITLPDGTILIKEFFSDGGSPFAEVDFESSGEIEISIDKNNFTSFNEANNFYDELQSEINLPFKKMGLLRKSHITDPEIVITLVELYGLYFLGAKLFPKIADKFADKIGDDVAKLYDLIKASAKKMVKYANPKNRPVTYILEFPGDTHIELIIKTENADKVATAFTSEKIKPLREKAESMKHLFSAEKIQFVYNDKQEWEMNYLLSANGETIGTPKAFARRDKAFAELAQKLIDKQNAKKE